MATECKEDVWFLDSGCSNHMTRDRSRFVDLDESIKTQVKMGNGVIVQAQGLGTIGVQTKRGKKFIDEVLFVPDLEQNLLSLGQLLEHDYALNFDNGECSIYDKRDGRQLVVNIHMEKNRSFPINFSNCGNQALKAHEIDSSWLWHKRLGHLNFRSLNVLQQKGMVFGLPKIEEKEDVCQGCALGKQHRQPFPKGVSWRAKEYLQLVHTDVCGPMRTTSHGGNKYLSSSLMIILE